VVAGDWLWSGCFWWFQVFIFIICHGQTTMSDQVRDLRVQGISDKITKIDFREGSFPKGKPVM